MDFLRSDIKGICSQLAEDKSLNFNLMECYNHISNYCKKNKCKPSEQKYEIKNGVLLINDEIIERVEYIKSSCASISEEVWTILEQEIGYNDYD